MQFNGKTMTAFAQFSGGGAGMETEDGGAVFNDYATNKATAKFASAFGSESKAAAEGAIAAGFKILRSGANWEYGENGEVIPESESDWRYNEAYGRGAEAFGKGAVAYSRASKSFGYRTQTGYPPSAEHAAARPEAIVQTDESGNPTYPADNVGQGAVALGADTAALANHTLAGGWCSIAGSYNAFAFGDHVEAWGDHSVALNYSTKAKGMGAIATGSGVEVAGKYSIGAGLNTKVNGNYSIGGGMKCEVDGNFATTNGLENKARANCVAVFGAGLVTPQQMKNGTNTGKGYGLGLFGLYNAYAGGELDDALLAVGNGTSDKDRKNAFVVRKNGSAEVAGAMYVKGLLSFGSITNVDRQKIVSHKIATREPYDTDFGDFVGQIWLEKDGERIVGVYMYAGDEGSEAEPRAVWTAIGLG